MQLEIVMTILVGRISVIGIKRQLLFGLEWVNLTQMTIISTTVGSLRSLVGSTTKESLRRNGVAIMVNKRVQNPVLGCNLKNDRMISVHFQGKPFNIMLNQVYAPTSNTEEAEVE